jgi:hypothetical protein
MSRTATFNGKTLNARRKNAQWMSFYSTVEEPERYLAVDHATEQAAQRGSWQAAYLKAIWIYRGYAPIVEG